MIMYMIYQTKDENDHWSLTCRTFLCSLHRTVSKAQSYLRIGFRQMGLFFQTAATPRAPLWSGAFKAPSKNDTAKNRFCAVGLAFQKKYSMIQKDDLLEQIWRPFCFQNMCYASPQNIHRQYNQTTLDVFLLHLNTIFNFLSAGAVIHYIRNNVLIYCTLDFRLYQLMYCDLCCCVAF